MPWQSRNLIPFSPEMQLKSNYQNSNWIRWNLTRIANHDKGKGKVLLQRTTSRLMTRLFHSLNYQHNKIHRWWNESSSYCKSDVETAEHLLCKYLYRSGKGIHIRIKQLFTRNWSTSLQIWKFWVWNKLGYSLLCWEMRKSGFDVMDTDVLSKRILMPICGTLEGTKDIITFRSDSFITFNNYPPNPYERAEMICLERHKGYRLMFFVLEAEHFSS